MLERKILGCICALAAGSVAAADLAETVRCNEIGFSQSVEQRDIDAFSSYVATEARFVGGTILRGREAVVAGWSPFFAEDGPRLIWRPAIIEIVDSAGIALSRGPYKLESSTESGERIITWGTFNSVWYRQPDGSWQVLFDAGGDHGKTPTQAEIELLQEPVNCAAVDRKSQAGT